jgi:RNA polymerase primary sigma factor
MSMRQLKISKSITTRESASLEKYLQEIGKVTILTPQEEADLTRLIKQGDKLALDHLTRANLRFVVSVAKQYQGQGVPLVDLINEGNMGLIKAAERFDDTRGFKFISFAVWWIRQSILQSLADNARLVRIPMNKVTLGSRIRKTQSLLEQKLERQPSTEELAEAMNINVEEMEYSLGHGDKHVSLDAPTMEDGEGSLLDVMENTNTKEADADMLYGESLSKEISRTLKGLPEKQRQTLCYFFGIGVERPLSLEDIARKFDLTTERVRQIKDKAISQLRTTQNFDLLRGFLGT